MIRSLGALITFLLLAQLRLYADPLIFKRQIEVRGRSTVTVTTQRIRLSDIADISSPLNIEQDALVALRKIVIEKSPAPGKVLLLTAENIIGRMKEAGVDLSKVGYLFPRQIEVARASRLLGTDEIRNAVEEFLKTRSAEIKLNSIDYADDVFVVPGITKIEALKSINARPGFINIELKATVSPSEINELPEETRFRVDASVDEWLEVPVATRPITKGALVEPGDVAMARLNLAAIPKDAAINQTRVIGLETKQNIGFGEVFRQNKLILPAVIDTGSKVNMRFRQGILEVVAKGTAIEAGTVGQAIKIRNDSSKKLIIGRVIEAGLVEVIP